MAKGGKRPGAGRPVATATLQTQEARKMLLERLMIDWMPIVEKAIDQAIAGDSTARAWLADQGLGKVAQSVDHTTKGEKLPTPILNAVPSYDGAEED